MKNIKTAGKNLEEAERALIMIHGRGGSAEDMLSLSAHLHVQDYALIAPQATGSVWYPETFLAPLAQNEPWLSSTFSMLSNVVNDIIAQGIDKKNIYILGFSQGACLALEFAARNATRWGGVVAFTGGLIGDRIYAENYKGDFKNTPIFIGSSDPDVYVPLERLHSSAKLLKAMNASVTVQIYKDMGHIISMNEIDQANQLILETGVIK